MNMLNSVAFGILAATLAFGKLRLQLRRPRSLEFEVASVRLSQPSGPNRVDAGLRMDGSQAHFGSLTLKDYIAMAYRVTAGRVSGPAWLASQRFDISAKLPDSGTRGLKFPQMLQSLLA